MVLQNLFPCTIEMITQNFEDFPEHRINFFILLRAINAKCFKAFFMIGEQEFRLIYSGIIWAIRHLERNVAETGLSTLHELLQNVEKTDLTAQFYQSYYLHVLQDVLAVLTDSLHKPGFLIQIAILNKLVGIVERGLLQVPLWTSENGNYPSNQVFVRSYIAQMLTSAFAHVSRVHIEAIVEGMFALHADETRFKIHMRDFLIQLKEFSSTDNSDLFQDVHAAESASEAQYKRSVPGLSLEGVQ
jgi:exportin-1